MITTECQTRHIDEYGDAIDIEYFGPMAKDKAEAIKAMLETEYPAAVVERMIYDGSTVWGVKYIMIQYHGDEQALREGGWLL